MLAYVLFLCFHQTGCLTYEFKDKIQCENAVRTIEKKSTGYSATILYCQEVRK